MRKQASKKLLSVLLALLMAVTILPVAAFAEGETGTDAVTAAPETEPAEAEQTEQTETETIVTEDLASLEQYAQPAAEIAVAATSEINYVTKTRSVPLPDGTFYRIVHLDCGRKYFTVSEIEKIIDYAKTYNYTHVELAFGNDGLRFLLDDMSLTASGVEYTDEAVTSAVQAGNDAFDSAANYTSAPSTEELTESEMDEIIAYAKSKGIGIIPMFDAPGHLYAVITAMSNLGISVTSYTASTSGKSPNKAVQMIDGNAAALNFVQALMQKYITYFANNGCTIFNIAADECGFDNDNHTMTSAEYTMYAKYVNSMAAMVQNAGMTAFAFSDGIYHKNLTTDTSFDTNIVVCFWTNNDEYATADEISAAGHKVINTHNKWYYVLGSETGTSWSTMFSYEFSKYYTEKEASDCMKVDGDTDKSTVPAGCMNALWCDNPGNSVNWTNVENHIAMISQYNSSVFTATATPTALTLTAGTPSTGLTLGDKDSSGAYAVKVDSGLPSYPTLQLTLGGTAEGATYAWESNNTDVAIVDDGLVTFISSGTVTITAKVSTAANANAISTASLEETGSADSVSMTFAVTVADNSGDSKGGEGTSEKTVDVTVEVGKTIEDTISGTNYYDAGTTYTTGNSYIATVEVTGKEAASGTTGTDREIASSATDVSSDTSSVGVLKDSNGNFIVIDSSGKLSNTTNVNEATIFTITRTTSSSSRPGSSSYRYTIKAGDYYLGVSSSSSSWWSTSYSLSVLDSSTSWRYSNNSGFYYSGQSYSGSGSYYLCYSSGWTVSSSSSSGNAALLYEVTEEKTEQTVDTPASTTIKFTGVGEGDTTFVIGNATYNITYNIKVTAPTNTENLSVSINTPVKTLPENAADVVIKDQKDTTGAEATILTQSTAEDGTVTITAGATVGTATVTYVTKNAGGFVTARYTYNVTVAEEDFSKVDGLPMQAWITDNVIYPDGATATSGTFGSSKYYTSAYYVKIPAKSAYSEDGVVIYDVMPTLEDAREYDNVYFTPSNYDSSVVTDWSSRDSKYLVPVRGMLHTNVVQTKLGSDYSNNNEATSNPSTAFYYVRYWNKAWAVSLDRVTWTTVDTSALDKTTASSTSSGTQIVVYYMIRTNITTEINTYVSDWGKRYGGTEYTDQVKGNYVLLDFAVRYQGSETTDPAAFPVTDKTFAYHCDYSSSTSKTSPVKQTGSYYYRELNNFRGIETGNYEIYMVTVTMTSDSADTTISDTTSYTYGGKEQIIWAVDEETRDNSGLDPYVSISGSNSVYSGCKIGGDMLIRGVEVYKSHGALITYYLRVKQSATDVLTVNYFVDGETSPFYTYNISVNASTTFNEGFDKGSTKNTLVNNTVTNDVDKVQTVSADLKTMPGINSKYRYVDYTLVSVTKADDLKTVNLYYTFNATKTFVVDFGLPLTITPKDVNENLADTDVKITGIEVTKQSVFADITTDSSSYAITYKLNQMISGSDSFGVQYSGTLTTATGTQDGTTASYTITIIPATTVYYEDGFAKFTDGSTAKWTIDGKETTADQALEVLGGENSNVYGYDPAYTNCTTFSLGSAHKVTVSSGMTTWPTAQFTFKGTGFDIISLTDNNSGAITVEVYKGKTTDTYVKGYIVDNYYGYTYNSADGTWTTTTGDNALYQIPVMKVTGLDYDEYTAVITVFYDDAFDHTTDNSYSFWLDAVRVYDPAGTSLDTSYVSDNEGYPQYIKLRDQLVSGTATTDTNKLLFIDGKENAEVSEYANYGPNNEVYLANGQAITFTLSGDLDNIATVQIGAKSPNGSDTDKAGMVVGNADAVQIGTATEMYYDISSVKDGNTVTITNTGNAILSLTNLKITYTTSGTVSLGTVAEEQQTQAVMMVRSLFAAASVEPEPEPEPEPEKVFEPERFEASWTSNVTKGRKATLTVKTSTDVEAITVNGETITSYRTRTERTGFGWNAQKVTYRQFTYTVTASESADYTVTAIDAEGTESAAITATLTVSERGSSFWNFWNSVKSLF